MRPDGPPAVLETALYATDLDAAEGFYRGLMGLDVVVRHLPRHVFFRCAGGMLLVFNPDETAGAPGSGKPAKLAHGARGPGHVCFSASEDQITAWRLHFEAHGVEIEDDFHWPNGARSLYLRDPAGNSIEFAEPRLWGY